MDRYLEYLLIGRVSYMYLESAARQLGQKVKISRDLVLLSLLFSVICRIVDGNSGSYFYNAQPSIEGSISLFVLVVLLVRILKVTVHHQPLTGSSRLENR